MIVLRLTPAQRSALECSGVDIVDDDPMSARIRAAWVDPDRLTFDATDRDAIVWALIELANAEDAMAIDPRRTPDERSHARGARAALGHLADRVMADSTPGLPKRFRGCS